MMHQSCNRYITKTDVQHGTRLCTRKSSVPSCLQRRNKKLMQESTKGAPLFLKRLKAYVQTFQKSYAGLT